MLKTIDGFTVPETVFKTYKSHKIVSAARIMSYVAGVFYNDDAPLRQNDPRPRDPSVMLEAEGKVEGVIVMLNRDMVRRYEPCAGDYLVCYDDGYVSISPKKAFEGGYLEMAPPMAIPDWASPPILAAARAAHEVNRAWCLSHGDTSQRPWEDAPHWQRMSALNGVMGVLKGNGPEDSHRSWLAEKISTGWKYGPVKDENAKTHPCMVEYADLPPEQKEKDRLYVTVVRAMLLAGHMMIETGLPQKPADIAQKMAQRMPSMTPGAIAGLPVSGYRDQTASAISLVNCNKEIEERVLRIFDDLQSLEAVDKRWLAIGKTDIEKGFMAMNRAIFKPDRVKLPLDKSKDAA